MDLSIDYVYLEAKEIRLTKECHKCKCLKNKQTNPSVHESSSLVTQVKKQKGVCGPRFSGGRQLSLNDLLIQLKQRMIKSTKEE